MRITQDAVNELASEDLKKAVSSARADNRETIRAEDIPE
jgi:histone H3/H4